MRLKDVAGDHIVAVAVAGQGTAGTADEFTGFRAPFRATITAAYWVPTAAITANGSNYFTLTVRNRAGAGSGSALPAQRAYSATNSTAFVAEAMTLSSTSTDLDLAEGDIVTIEKIVTGTGLAMPDGTVQVHLKAR
jgi:hypothetical protein